MSELTAISFEQESPDVKAQVQHYWSQRADGFLNLREAELESNKGPRWEKEISKLLPEGKGLNILDVGCGSGFFEVLLARMGHKVTGIDLTPEMIEKANLLIEEYGCRANCMVMDAENLEFEDETFDVVISRNLTWTLPNPDKGYAEWTRVLKKGGVLLNFDAEYAKDHHKHELPKVHAHHNIDDDLKEECHKIYHMLSISSIPRPGWDEEVLQKLGMDVAETDTEIGKRIYKEQDQFYIPNEVFRIYAQKKDKTSS